MRILHVTDCYLPSLGGIEMLVSDLVSRQRAAGHDARVVTSEPLLAGSPADPPWVHRVPVSGRSALAHSVFGTRAAGAVLTGLDPDVVHAHISVLSPFATATSSAAASRGVPTVITAHSLWTSIPAGLTMLAGASLRLSRWPVLWTAVSEAAAQSLRRLVGQRVPVRILPNAVDAADWWVDPAERAAGDGVPTVVSVMRLARRKRPLPLARMLRQVRAALPARQPMRAIIIGDGPLLEALAGDLRRHRMTEWVELPGRLDRAEIRGVLATADVYVAPAPLESFGIAALEARCAGLPVVASARSGVRDFIDPGRDGLLTADDAAMVRALVGLLGDPVARARFAAHARASVPDLGWDRAVARSLEVYAEATVIAGRAVAGPSQMARLTA